MAIIESKINKQEKTYLKNQSHMQTLVNELNSKLQLIHEGGGYKARARHQQRGKLLPFERIETLLDYGSSFTELSPLAGYDLYDDKLPAGGIITGIGKIHHKDVMLIVNDATVKGGTYYPVTVKKHLRAQEIAAENYLPCIHLVDSGGAFLPMQDQVFPDKDSFGRIFYQQAQLSTMGLSQIAVVMGPCIAGGAYVAAMSDETIMVENQGTIYLGGPQLVQAATGEKIDPETLGGADVHCKISGVADHLAHNDTEALELCRNIVAHLPSSNPDSSDSFSKESEQRLPLYAAEELYGLIPDDLRQPMDCHEIIARLVDYSEFQEFKSLYGTTLVCGFAHIDAHPVGILANNGILFSESALKGTHFIELCNQRGIPIVFLQNIAGFMVGKHYEHQGIAKDGAKMVTAVATSRVAKFTVIIGGSFGAGNYAMCGRAYGARQLWMWPNAKISVMGGDVAASLMTQIKKTSSQNQSETSDSDEIKKLQMIQDREQDIKMQFEDQGSPYYSSARLWDDGIIDPVQTREYLALGLSLAKRKPFDSEVNWPIFRM